MGWQDRAYNRDDNQGIPPVVFKFPPFTRLTIALLCINFGLFLLKVYEPAYALVLKWGGLRFADGQWMQAWRWITYQYLHADALHVFFNMIGVYFFLPALELRWGWKKALGFYTLGGIAAGLAFLLLMAITGRWNAGLIGASGSVFAIMGAVALLYPERQLILLFFPLPIRVAVGIFALIFILSSVADKDFSNAAHLGGLAFGFLSPYLAGPYLSKHRRRFEQRRLERQREEEINEQQEVDRILAKVAEKGMHSLTSREKKALDRASQNQRRRDAEREKKLRASW